MGRRNITRVLVAIGIYFIFFFISTIFESDFWGNLLSPVGALISSGLIFRVFFITKKTDYRRNIWLCFSLASLFWFLADALWAMYEWFISRNPADSQLILFLYFLTSVFLLAGLVIFTAKSIRSWNAMQLFIDSITVAASLILLLWILFLDKDLGNIGMVYKDGWYSMASILIDLAIIIGISIWYISLRSGKIYRVTRYIYGFLFLFALTDIIYYYLYFKDLYIPNSIIDALYIASLLGLAVSISLIPPAHFAGDAKYIEGSNTGYNLKGLILLPTPALVLMYEGFNITDLFVCGIIITAHTTVTYFIQSAILKEQMLMREKTINLDLERKIGERTRELIEKNALLDFLSNQDTVTSLSNRRFFLLELEKKVLTLEKEDTLSLAFIDLDRFKTINDEYGHYVGDNILIELANRLRSFESPDTLIARLGGDEFVIAVSGRHILKSTDELLQRVVLECSKPIQIGEYSFEVTISVGVSMYPVDAVSTDMLLRNADMAMYQAKKEGCNRIVVFNDILKQKNRQKNKIEIGLKKADFNSEFTLFYQPQFTIPDKKLIGMEALLRWNCPGIGSVSPAEFIPVAEEINLIIPIGEWVMARAAGQIAQWNREYDSNLKMAVNVSPKQLGQADYYRQILSALAIAGIPPEWIDLEITEGVALESQSKVNRVVNQFKDSGITISIDDFGTGYSSLSYLKMFPFQRVKIALQLIDNITFDRYDLQIVRSILQLAESIGVDCIAEGVETQEQFDLLHGLGCRQMQGYLLGRPASAKEFEERYLKPYKTSTYDR